MEWDSTFFGFQVATLLVPSLTNDEWKRVQHELKALNVRLIYWKRPAELDISIDNAQVVLADMPCTFEAKQWQTTPVGDNEVRIFSEPKVPESLIDVGIKCGVYSRFRADSRIPEGKFEEMYRMWIEKSVQKQLADDVLVFYSDSQVVGLITVSVENSVGHIGLFGVDEAYRGQRIGSKLLEAALHYFGTKNCMSVEVVTQQTNHPACRAYERAGFHIKDKQFYYHIWL